LVDPRSKSRQLSSFQQSKKGEQKFDDERGGKEDITARSAALKKERDFPAFFVSAL
jgi:hypothetical protein